MLAKLAPRVAATHRQFPRYEEVSSLQKLTLVVTCTDRKRLPASVDLQVRSLPGSTLAARADAWIQRLSAPVEKLPLVELYKGEAWQQVRELVRTAWRMGYAPELIVASAGLGLRHSESQAGGYAATFAHGHADSVASRDDDARAWWACMQAAPDVLPAPSRLLTGRVLVVASSAYARGIATTLHQVAETASIALLVGGMCDIPGLTRLSPNKALRAPLGGTASSLNLRMAQRWLEMTEGRELVSNRIRQEWQRWCASVEQTESYDRRRLTDEQVQEFISEIRAANPRASASSVLRALRDGGFACEQSRCRRLFHERR